MKKTLSLAVAASLLTWGVSTSFANQDPLSITVGSSMPSNSISGANTGALGKSITTSDDNYSNSSFANDVAHPQNGSGGYGNHEDQETETNPNTYTTQNWDLEGMYLSGSKLSLVGGFNFWTGENSGGYTYNTGDIFINTQGPAYYGTSGGNTQQDNHTSPNGVGPTGSSYTDSNKDGWDYVIHFNGDNTYTVYSLTSNSTVVRVMDVPSSNPWKYDPASNTTNSVVSVNGVALDHVALSGAGSFTTNTLTTYGSGSQIGLLGDGNVLQPNGQYVSTGNNTHYYLTVDISFIPVGQVATFHYTVECGNDDLIGKGNRVNVPDAASTAMMLGGALMAIAGIRKFRR